MKYQRIRPFPPAAEYEFPELRALSSVWKERKGELEGSGAYQEFLKKLQREWAIETGIIERLYTWDRGVTEVLIEQGIEASIISHRGGVSREDAEHIQAVIQDHLGIVEGLFAYIKGDEPLTEHFIRGLQAQFTANQDYTDALTESGQLVKIQLLKGEYKKSVNNPRRPDGEFHSYCPPELTKEEMERLVSTYREAEALFYPELKSAWLHHRFTQIHPFQDGNGRVARALASLVFLREGLFPLVIRESDRKEYIGSLEEADSGNLKPLTELFARRQKESILKALGLEQQVQQSKYAEHIISSALEVLKSKYSNATQKLSAVYDQANKLFAVTEGRFREIAVDIDPKLRTLTPPGYEKYQARMNSASSSAQNRHYFQNQIVEAARKFDYFANLDKHRSWVRITLATEQEFDYVISFHGYGHGDTGVLVASAFTYIKAPKEGGGTEPVSLHPAATDLFQFNYAEPYDSTEKRYKDWLESSVAIAMAEWKRSLQA